MKRKTKITIPVIISMAVIIAALAFRGKKEDDKTTYTYAEITKGDIENTVDATGTIEPVTTVEVGTQVSGIINKIYVDFNDRVKKNQLMAVIDTTILSVQVRDAKANLLRSQAQFDEAKFSFERTEDLYKRNLLSELEYITAQSNYQSAKAGVMSSQNSLDRAELNMRYAFIRSPIDGTVIYREVEEGQTVASSFQTPRLFLIAEDLSKMEIHALVDESEIGQIKVGQSVQFEVQAFDEKKFTGTVRQVWLQPETVQNVVNYTVVVDADNPGNLLLPGMTATIDFIVEQKKDVLLAPIAATKLQPTEKMVKIMMANMRKQFENRKDSTGDSGNRRGGFPGMGGNMGTTMPTVSNGNFAVIWFFNDKNELQSMPIHTGSNDGKNIEIKPMMPGLEIEPGMQIISKIETTEPLASETMRMPGRPGGGFGRRPF
ncbi:efflux RND transporter periplasmic adaptor subunit [candidate division KSB1 bacterium]|nr:efflux RND transporter periplasmic adaptor subunit [candidate division KSB1 bacterium]